jgi:hypothetical protein
MISSLADIGLNTIAVVDDDPDNTAALSCSLELSGCRPISFADNLRDCTIDTLLKEITSKANGVLCDNRLSYRSSVTFCGAEAVARCIQKGFPAILVSEFTDFDIYTTIGQWRRYIPVVIPKDMITSQIIVQGYYDCLQELHNNISFSRKPRRCIVRVVDVGTDKNVQYVEAVVPQWNTRKVVRFPCSLLTHLPQPISAGTVLLADVNIGTEHVSEIYFDNFEIAPEPDPNDGLA